MTDLELARFLCPDDVELGVRFVVKATPEKRAAYERMSEVCDEIELHAAGVGPKPRGVIMCGPKQVRFTRERKDRRSARMKP
jgi:hypothetical protein